ncbi:MULTISPECIES: pyruvate kinase [Priestia]|uniref:pyruvate kinase n=1 Tax=Priestia TaxID=2800373 RepID=UPI0005EC040C|nr:MULTISPECIES: pyruvate kinase [Priestia]KJL05578.1 hypothetical protein N178_06765 [Priestia aryabhattai B8W22]MBX4163557.1 hypothetical protein [Priestia megaterium]
MAIDRICTIGPASNKKDVLERLLGKGMTIARLNLSHGSHESHKTIIDTLRSLNSSIQILGDLQGPKIRLGVIKSKEVVLKEGDGIMIARGDLGVELPYEWIPLLQKILIHECRMQNKYVITATQMLQSMVRSAIPTRAEVTDVFQAVLDGTNAVMLSGETAAGKYPIESMETLYKISHFAETLQNKNLASLSKILAMLKSSR